MPRPKKQPLKSGRFVVHEDRETRPSVRYVYSGRSERGGKAVEQYAYKVLEQVKRNILNQMHGRWTPIQWGPKAGSPALLKGVNEWSVYRLDSRTYRVQPKQPYRKKWRGHVGGMLIKPKRAKALHFIGYGDVELFRPWVKLPRRDPRPTEYQLRRL